MKKSMKFLKRVFSLSLALIMMCFVFTGCGKTPIETVEDGTANLVKNIGDEYSVLSTLTKALKGGSVQLNIAADDFIEDASINGIDGSLTLYFGERDMAVNAAAKLNGVSVGDVTVYMDSQGVAVASDAFFGRGTAYGTDYKDADARFEDSIFSGDGQFGLGTIPEITAPFSQIGSIMTAGGDAKALWKELKGDIFAAVEANCTATVGKGTYTVNGASVKTNNVTVVAEEDQINNIVVAVIDVLLLSDSFKTFANNHAELFEMFGIEDVLDLLDDIRDEIKEDDEATDGMEIELNAYIGRSSKELTALEVKIEADGMDDQKISLVCAPSSEKLENIKFTYCDGDDETEFNYEVKEDTDNSYKSKLTLREKWTYKGEKRDSKETLFDYSWNKSTGDFKLKLVDEIEVSGNINAGKKTSTVNIDKIEGGGMDLEFSKCEIIIKASDEMPVIEEYEDILEISETDFEKIYNDIIELFSTALGE